MGKTGKWFKNFLSGKKEKAQKDEKNAANGRGSSNQNNAEERLNPTTQVVVFPRPTTPKEKKRWSFRRSSATAAGPKDMSAAEVHTVAALPDTEQTREKEAVEIVDVTTDVVIPSTDDSTDARTREIEESAAVKIQSVFRSYLARKALKALRGLVKLQALVRGHLVRKQATETLRCMQALVTAQARARAQRIRTVADDVKTMHHRQSTHRRSSQEKIKHSYHDMEENIKIVEMDQGEYGSNDNGLNSYAVPYQQQNGDRMDNRMPTYYSPQQQQAYSKHEYQQISPAPSAMTDLSPRTCSGHFEDYTFATAQSSPQCFTALSRPDPSRTPFSFPNPDFADTMSYEYPLYPSYMANTESSRAKARSQSAPKQRPEFERQPSRGRRPSVEGRGIPKGARMQRSSSHVSSTAQNYQYPWSVKLDKSTVSLKESECGSSCSVFTNANYCRSVVSYDVSTRINT